MKTLNTEILKLAREVRLITQEELAMKIGIEQGTLSKIEKRLLSADVYIIEKISNVLDFPIDFFYQVKKVTPVEGHYRRRLSSSVKNMKKYIAQMTISEWHFVSMLDEIELPELKLPSWDVLEDGSPAMCAKFMREYWKMPKGHITNLTKFIEDNGIVIIALDLGELDGFSTLLMGNIPAIYVNKKLPADRYRITIAHELGHLIMHFGNKIRADRDLEEEAFQFGIELLVPENNIKPYLNKITIEKLADLKGYWYVSMASLLRYANTLGMVTGNQYRYLWMQMSSLGYKKNEPVVIPKESPEIINEILYGYLNDLGYTKNELAKILYLTENELDYLYFGKDSKLRVIRK